MRRLTLDELARDPAQAAHVPLKAALELLAEAGAAAAVLSARVTALQVAPPAAVPAPASAAERWLTPKQAAQAMEFREGYILDLCRQGVIPSVRQGKYRRIPEAAFLEWQASRQTGLDGQGSVALPSGRGARRDPPAAAGPRTYAVVVRPATRRARDDRSEMGDGRPANGAAGRSPSPGPEGAQTLPAGRSVPERTGLQRAAHERAAP
jgi:excisionase family DNA binding protein